MKNKISLLVGFCLLSIITKAQNETMTTSPVGTSSFGVYGGINFQNINGTTASGNALSNSLVTRFTLGINEEIPIVPEFYFQFGLQFITKGTKGSVPFTDNNGTHEITREVRLNYFEIPLNLIYKPLLGTGHFVLGFGPYVGYCIGGKATYSGAAAPADADLQIEQSAATNDPNNLVYYKPFDVGANFLVGYELQNGLNFMLNSQLGLININSNTSSSLTNKNTGFGLTVGYRF